MDADPTKDPELLDAVAEYEEAERDFMELPALTARRKDRYVAAARKLRRLVGNRFPELLRRNGAPN